MKRLALTTAALSIAAGAMAQAPAGSEFAVNTYTASLQRFPAVAVEADGDFVVVWTSWYQDGARTGIFGQRYARDGAPRGAEFQVNTYTTDYQGWYGKNAVAAAANGDFIVAWPSRGQDGSLWGVFAQRFSGSGARLGGEFQVNSFTTGSQGGVFLYYNAVAVDMSPRGAFVVAWASDQDATGYEIYAQRYDATGARRGGEFRVNTVTAGHQANPNVALNASGEFVVAWSTPDGDGSGVAARRFDAAGAPVGAEFRVNSYTAGNQAYPIFDPPVVALRDDGTFVVVWESLAAQDGVFGRGFDAADTPLGPDFQVNSSTAGFQGFPWVGVDESGTFVAVWISPDGSGDGIFGQRFLADGTRRGAEFQVNTGAIDSQTVPVVGADAVGNFAAAFETIRSGNDRDVLGRRFGGLFPTALRVDTGANGILEPGETADVRPSWQNQNGAAQTFTSTLALPSGPPGGVPAIVDGTAAYGTVADGATIECPDCFAVTLPAPPSRPALHWDATAVEGIVPDVQGQRKPWRLHVGASFLDVPSSSPFYRFVETLLHNDVTGGCSATQYCPGQPTTRQQMAVFVLVAKHGAGYVPPDCGASPMFADVPTTSPFCRWVEELARRGVVAGCGGGNYCPGASASREQMAVFVLRALDPALAPPACVPPNLFADLPETSPFCRWVEELANRAVVTGCGGGNYCPGIAVTREQMGVFIGVAFGLTLYGP